MRVPDNSRRRRKNCWRQHRFQKALAEGREMEARIRERVELSNFGVVAEFKDETRRASDTLREIANLPGCVTSRPKRSTQSSNQSSPI